MGRQFFNFHWKKMLKQIIFVLGQIKISRSEGAWNLSQRSLSPRQSLVNF